jgi:hypothetical protein
LQWLSLSLKLSSVVIRENLECDLAGLQQPKTIVRLAVISLQLFPLLNTLEASFERRMTWKTQTLSFVEYVVDDLVVD